MCNARTTRTHNKHIQKKRIRLFNSCIRHAIFHLTNGARGEERKKCKEDKEIQQSTPTNSGEKSALSPDISNNKLC